MVDAMIRLYCSAPLTNGGTQPMTEERKQAFRDAAGKLREAGFDVVNPVELDEAEDCTDWTWQQFMKRDLHFLLDCDGIATLYGWQESEGARFEVDVAKRLGFRVAPHFVWTELEALVK